MIVVSNTSPLINLAAVGELELLEKLYIRILVPEAVYHEIVVAGAGQPGAEEVRTWPCFEMRVVQDQALLADLRRELDAGEAEAIALAVESGADLALIDERRGRMVAGRHRVRVLGLLGVLIAAKEQNLLQVIRPIMVRLMSDARFWISDDLYQRVLERAGEL